MQRNERGGFLRGDQNSGPRMGQAMPQPPGAHMPHAPPRPPMNLMQQSRPYRGPPQGGGGFHGRPQDGNNHTPVMGPPGPPFPHAPSGMRPNRQGQVMRPQPPMTGNWGSSSGHMDRNGARGPSMHGHNSNSTAGGSKPPLMGGGQPHAPHALHHSAQPAPRLRATDSNFENLANVVVDPQEVSAVGYLERVRAMNALAKVGAAARADHSAAAIKAAASAFRSGTAFKGSAYGGDVTMFVPSSVEAGTAATEAAAAE